MRRRGFTLLEVMLASLLASFVLIGCIGVFGFIDRTERALSRRFEDVQEFARCQATLRRAMQSLVAAYPQAPAQAATAGRQGINDIVPDDAEDGGDGARGRPGASDRRGSGGRGDRDDPEAGADDNARLAPGEEEDEEDDRRGRRRLGDSDEEEVDQGPEYFAMKPLLPADRAEGVEVGDAPWRLELVLSASPTMIAAERGAPIRGAFDIVQSGEEGDVESWALLWTPIKPPGEPVVLIDGLALALMAVLPRDTSEFTGQFGARQIKQFPRAVRFILWTRGGAKTDWVFEPGIIEGVAP